VRRTRAAGLLAVVAAVAGASSGCGRVVGGKAEDAIKPLLPQYIGPADDYQVRVSGGTGAMLRGRLGRVQVEGKNVRLTPEFTVSALSLDLRDVSVDRGQGRLQNVASSTFSARIAEPDLNRYLGNRRPGIRDLSVRAGGDGRLSVRARPELLGYPTLPVEVRGTLAPRPDSGGQKLDFVPDGARVSILPIPNFVVEHLVSRLNPVVDLSDGLAVPISVQSTRVQAGSLTLTGVIPSDALLRAADAAVSAAEQKRTGK